MLDAAALCLELTSAIVLLSFAGGSVPGPYEKIYFRRDGGGNKAFYVRADESHRLLSFEVVRYNFRDTTYSFEQSLNEKDEVCGLVSSILSGSVSIGGSSTPETRPTGTWAHIYAVTPAGSQVEITDTKVRDRLMALEKLVEGQRVEPQR